MRMYLVLVVLDDNQLSALVELLDKVFKQGPREQQFSGAVALLYSFNDFLPARIRRVTIVSRRAVAVELRWGGRGHLTEIVTRK